MSAAEVSAQTMADSAIDAWSVGRVGQHLMRIREAKMWISGVLALENDGIPANGDQF